MKGIISFPRIALILLCIGRQEVFCYKRLHSAQVKYVRSFFRLLYSDVLPYILPSIFYTSFSSF